MDVRALSSLVGSAARTEAGTTTRPSARTVAQTVAQTGSPTVARTASQTVAQAVAQTGSQTVAHTAAQTAARTAADPVSGTTAATAGPKPEEIRKATREFEAMWIEMMLHMARPEASATLSGESDSTRDMVLDMADQQIAHLLAAQGGLGLAHLVTQGLEKSSAPAGAGVSAGAGTSGTKPASPPPPR